MSEPIVRVQNLSHSYGPFSVLHDVSFEVEPGAIFGFIGPNGAGKTTTIRVMSTLLEPSQGTVFIDGRDVALAPEAVRRSIGYMPDHAGVYERLSVREYLEFFADSADVTRDGTDYSVVDGVLELTDLAKLEDKLVPTMSKGMKQRLQLARVLLHDPKLLILDEPASDLDPRARIEMRDLLLELKRMGKTIFLSSHILSELADVCTSVAILEKGRLVAAGPIEEIARKMAGESPSLECRLVRIKTLEPLDRVRGALADEKGVLGLEPGPQGTIVLSHAGGDAELARIVRALVLAECGIFNVEPERNELERIFLEVTRGDLQ